MKNSHFIAVALATFASAATFAAQPEPATTMTMPMPMAKTDHSAQMHAMMGKAEYWSLQVSQHIDVRRFGRQGERRCSQCCLAIQPGSRDTGAGQQVGDRFQS